MSLLQPLTRPRSRPGSCTAAATRSPSPSWTLCRRGPALHPVRRCGGKSVGHAPLLLPFHVRSAAAAGRTQFGRQAAMTPRMKQRSAGRRLNPSNSLSHSHTPALPLSPALCLSSEGKSHSHPPPTSPCSCESLPVCVFKVQYVKLLKGSGRRRKRRRREDGSECC